jgi:hypothetical protein
MNNNKETTISKTIRIVSEFVNDSIIKKTDIYSKKKDGYWDQFFVAVDTIEDTCAAIENFLKDSGGCFMKNPHLSTYGILQALVIQQDAVNFLKIALFGENKKIIWHKLYPELGNIRQLRNETIGHPAKKEKKIGRSKYLNDEITYCTIDSSSLSQKGFDYMLWKHSKNEKKRIDFSNIIEIQNKNLNQELEIILKELQKEERQHKFKFKDEKLSNFLNHKSLYQINLIYGVNWNDHLAWPSFEHYLTQYKKIKDGLEKRYGKINTFFQIPGTELVIKKLDHIFSKIKTFKSTGQFDKQELEIYVDALDASLKELRDHLLEIDNKFKF